MREHEGKKRRRRRVSDRVRRRRGRRLTRILTTVLIIAVVLGIGVTAYDLYTKYLLALIKDEAVIEAGAPVDLSLFVEDGSKGAVFVSDVSAIDTSVPSVHSLSIRTGIIITVTKDVTLNVVDTTAPIAEAIPQTVYAGEIPDPGSIVSAIIDITPVTVEYDGTPDTSSAGEYFIPVRLTDQSGNVTIIEVPFTVIEDVTAPVISGAHNIEAVVGDSVDFTSDVTVTDDYDLSPVLTIDDSRVNYERAGRYHVTYTATDEHSNSSAVTVTLILRDVPEAEEDADFAEFEP